MYLRAVLCTFQISVDCVPVGGRGGVRGGGRGEGRGGWRGGEGGGGKGGPGVGGRARGRGIECILTVWVQVTVNCTHGYSEQLTVPVSTILVIMQEVCSL